ncbi:hypothetical protein FNV43_RR14276 [Rhamnella rubrinervis]|uniref:Uncharacterized protein n=1 Tax=Rhamnella rubrinervis TaxID=2594499 RepID=A0A8K0H2U3_9ROSA|nr:hypothetical protein FNV43_RR14276 [Rhamnella rubrinervis]
MSFRIRGFLNTVVSDSKIEKLKAGWQATAKCLYELGLYSRERVEEYRRASRKAFFLDEDEEFTRHAEAAMRIREENWDLRRQIEALKARKRSAFEALKARKRRGE